MTLTTIRNYTTSRDLTVRRAMRMYTLTITGP